MNKVDKQKNDMELYQNEKRLRTSIDKLTHEIKNPLSVCTGYLEMMEKNDKKTNKKYLDIVKEEIRRTLSVINDFSFFVKEKSLNIEVIDLNVLLEDILKIMKPLVEEKKGKILLITPENTFIKGDYPRLKQAFINIIKNAIESKNIYPLQIIMKVKNQKGTYQIMIKDNGCGMTKEELNHIFEDYYTTKSLGTGLGIPYTKEIIELHQGTIKYVSKKNIGTTVSITLPKEKSPKTFSNNNC